MSVTKAKILSWSRLTGRLLALALVMTTLAAGVQVFRLVQAQSALGHLSGQAFIAEVRACRHNGPKPRPAWAACERIVREGR